MVKSYFHLFLIGNVMGKEDTMFLVFSGMVFVLMLGILVVALVAA